MNNSIKITKSEIIKIITTIKIQCPEALQYQNDSDFDVMVDTWFDILKECTNETVWAAVKNALKNSVYQKQNWIGVIWQEIDRKKNPRVDEIAAANARADRERWYAQRRAAAENEADRKKETVRKRFKRFGELEKEHKAIGLEIAKRELAFDKSQDGYAAQRLEEATSARDRIEENMAKYVAECGYTMDELSPKWHCEKCQDTGWQADGTACDCYNKEKGNEGL